MSRDELAQRRAVVAEARAWLRTPFHDCAAIKGVGVDCANLLAQVYERTGIFAEPVKIEPYSAQWFLHRSEERFMAHLTAAGGREIEEAEAMPGDCVVYKIGRCFAHGAIIVSNWPGQIIHAHKASRGVVLSSGTEGDLLGKERRFFTMWARG